MISLIPRAHIKHTQLQPKCITMKKTLFLSHILAALLACTGISHALTVAYPSPLIVDLGGGFAEESLDVPFHFIDTPELVNGKIVIKNPHAKRQLNNGTLRIARGCTGKIQSYLSGSAEIHLAGNFRGEPITLQGLFNPNPSTGRVSVLTNAVWVQPGTTGIMKGGYYGGVIWMYGYSTLTFDMDILPAGVVEERKEGGVEIYLGGSTDLETVLDLAYKSRAINLDVSGPHNILRNGSLTGTLTLNENSHLRSEGAMASWDGPTSIVMKNNSKLEMVRGKDLWINDVSKLRVEGTATITDGFLRVRPGTEYTLGNGVENLKGEGITSFCLDRGTLNLNGKPTNLDIKVWRNQNGTNIVKNGSIGKYVEIISRGNLTLQDVTISNNASFLLGDGARMEMTGSSTLSDGASVLFDMKQDARLDMIGVSGQTLSNTRFTLGNGTKLNLGGATALLNNITFSPNSTVALENGLLRVPGKKVINEENGENGADGVYKLAMADGELRALLINDTTKLKLGKKAGLYTDETTNVVIGKEWVNNPDCKVDLNVTTEGKFIFGETDTSGGSGQSLTAYGRLNITHLGPSPSHALTVDVNNVYFFIGDLNANMNGASIGLGVIGTRAGGEQDTGFASTVTVAGASSISLTSFEGKYMKLQARDYVNILGGVKAHAHVGDGQSSRLEITGNASVFPGPDITFNGSLDANTIVLDGREIKGETSGDDLCLRFRDCTITATESIDIKQAILGIQDGEDLISTLEATAVGAVSLRQVGQENNPLGRATITSSYDAVTLGAELTGTPVVFTGGTLTATAAKAVTFHGDVVASGDVEVVGAGVVIDKEGSLTAATATITSIGTAGDITIAGTLKTGESGTLNAGRNISITGSVEGGSLTATANGSITLNSVSIGGNAAVLDAKGGGITARSFSGGSLRATAAGAVNITLNVNASDTAVLKGTGPDGDITIGKMLRAGESSTLDAARNIVVKGSVEGGDLTATAVGSISLNTINIVEHAAVLDAKSSGITASSFKGGSLVATAAEAVTFHGNVEASGDVEVEGAGVVIDMGGSLTAATASITSIGTAGDITIAGALKTGVSGTLNAARNIDVKGKVEGGDLAATAAQSITLGGIGVSARNVELAAQEGNIQVASFSGSSLKATAGEALTVSGSVEATGADTWTIDGYGAQYAVALEGGSVSIGSLAANAGSNYVHSTTGDITIGGTLSAAVSSTLVSDAGNINLQGNVLGGNLTARARQSITLKDIGTSESHVETAELTALAGSIKAGSITADKLQIRTQNGVDLEAVTITQTGQNPNRIISETGNVALGMYSGTMTSIMARQGSITVGSLSGASNSLQAFNSVTVNGSVSGWYNSYISQEQVVFNGAAGSNDLNYATIRAPKVSWTNGTTASHLTLTGFSEADSTQVTVGGSLELHDSRVKGDVRINAKGDSKVTVDESTITGAVSGTKEVELHDGSVGKVSVDSTSASSLKLTSSGNSAITAQGEVPLNINELILTRGGTLTVGTGTDDPTGGLSVSNLTVTGSSSLVANVALSRNASLTFALGGENAVSSGEGGFTPVLSIDGTLSASTAKKSRSTITLIVDTAPNPGEKFALMSMMKGSSRLQIKTGTIFNVNTRTEETVLGSCFTVENNVLYFTYGTSLTTAVWTGGLGDHWDTTSSNWRTDDRILCYRNGMEVKFDDSSLEKDVVLDAIEGGIQPSDVLVDNSQGHDYTFSGNGSISGDASLVKSGDGTLTINTENTYSGGTTISGGTLVMGNAAALGTGAVTLRGGTLDLGENTIATDITVEGTSSLEEAVGLVKTSSLGNGELTMGSLTVKADQNLTLLGSTTISDTVAITLGDGAALDLGNNTIEANITLEGGASIGNGSLIRELTVKEGRQLSLLGNLKTVGNIILENNAALDLNGQTLSSGGDISRGQVHLSPDAATASIGGGTLESLAIVEGNQTLSLLGNLSGGGSILLDDKAGLDLGGYTLSNAVALGGDATIGNGMLGNSLKVTVSANHTLTLGGDLSGQGAVSLANGASLALNGKAISTRVMLAGANATIGNGMLDSDLSVLGGKTLILGGDLSGQGSVSLANGATLNLGGYTLSTNVTLAGANATIGNGTIDNNLAVSAGNTLSLSAPTTVTGNLTLGNLATLSFSLSGENTATPALTVGESMLTEGPPPHLIINLTAAETLDDSALYALIRMEDGKTPEFWNPVNVEVSGLTRDIRHLFWTDGTLFYSSGTPVTALTWTGSVGNAWSGEDKNWVQDDLPCTYRDRVALWFDNDGAHRDLQLTGAYAPSSIMVDNDEAHDYSFSGPGRLTGSMQLGKEGSGTLAINTANEYTGGTTIHGGTLVMGNDNALGTGVVTLRGGTLDIGGFTLSNNVALEGSAAIGHGTLSGRVTLQADCVLTLLANTNLKGDTTLTAGATLDLGLNTIDGGITISGGASIGNGALNGTASVGENLTLTLLGDLSGKGSVSLGNGATLALNGNALSANLTLEGSATIGQGDFNGTATVGENQTLSLDGNVAGWGTVSLGNGATLALDGKALSTNVTVDGNSATINQGEFNGTATVRENYTLTLAGDISGRGSVSLKNGASLALNGNALSTNVTVDGSATINQGAFNGTATVEENQTLTLGGNVSGTGRVSLKNGAALDLNGNALSNGVSLAGNASIGNGTIDNNLTVGAGYTLAFSAPTTVQGDVSLGNGSTLSFTLSGEAADSPVLTVHGNMLLDGGTSSSLGIHLAGEGPLQPGEQYALVKMLNGRSPDFWNPENVSLSGISQDPGDLFWSSGTLFFCSGGAVPSLTWIGNASNTWGGSDKNWAHNGTAYSYRDGVDLVFNNESNNRNLKLDAVYAPKSVTVDNSAEYDYSFSATENGTLAGSMQLVKKGSGTLTINNANEYSGGTLIKGGTLVMANAQAFGTGTVTLEAGTLRLANGLKNFDLKVTGTDTRLEGNWDNSFTGTLTLEEGSCLVSASAMANWAGPSEIVMKNGSTLKMVTGQDIWINDITNLHVEGEATMVDTFLRINPNTNGGEYTLGNGVQNIKGQGVTAYCLDGSIFNLGNHTTNLNIIIWNAQPNKYNIIKDGTVDTQVEIHPDCNLALSFVNIGEHAQFLVQSGAHLDMASVAISDKAAFILENNAYVNLGGSARLGAFAFTGATATIDGDMLHVGANEVARLGTDLKGTAVISLGEDAMLDLRNHTLDIGKIRLADGAAAASVDNGTLTGNMTLNTPGKELRLGNSLKFESGNIEIQDGATLAIGNGCMMKGSLSGSGAIVKEDDGTSNITGGMENFSGSVTVLEGVLNLMNAASLNVQDVTIAGGTLGIYSNETPDADHEATLTIRDTKTLTAGRGSALNANLMLQRGSTLDVFFTEGTGLLMGSSVTLTPGMMLSEDDMYAVGGLGIGNAYNLFRDVEGFSIGDKSYTEITFASEQWVKASEVFDNEEFRTGGRDYYLFYSGTNPGGNGSNVGTVYLMQLPEPATGTLSLLALCALAARRRKR